jgi:hypothetical protein
VALAPGYRITASTTFAVSSLGSCTKSGNANEIHLWIDRDAAGLVRFDSNGTIFMKVELRKTQVSDVVEEDRASPVTWTFSPKDL